MKKNFYLLFLAAFAYSKTEFISNLPPHDIQVLKSYKLKYNPFIEPLVAKHERELPIEWVESLENADFYPKKPMSTLSLGCALSTINAYLRSFNLPPISEDNEICFKYQQTEKKGMFSTTNMIYAEKINFKDAITSPQTCESDSLSIMKWCNQGSVRDEVSAQQIIGFRYLTLIKYGKECSTDACKTDLALLATGISKYSNILDNLEVKYPDSKQTIDNDKLLQIVKKDVANQVRNKWDLAWAIYGQIVAYQINAQIINNGQDINNDKVWDSYLSAYKIKNSYFNRGYGMYSGQKNRYSQGLADAKTTIKKYKPNAAQSDIILNYLSEEMHHLDVNGDLQGFN